MQWFIEGVVSVAHSTTKQGINNTFWTLETDNSAVDCRLTVNSASRTTNAPDEMDRREIWRGALARLAGVSIIFRMKLAFDSVSIMFLADCGHGKLHVFNTTTCVELTDRLLPAYYSATFNGSTPCTLAVDSARDVVYVGHKDELVFEFNLVYN
jgi:hypothetical protein